MCEEDKKMFHRLMYYNDKEHLAKRIIELQKGINYLKSQLKQKENIIKEIKAQLDYLETYSSKEDVFEDMKRRLNNIEKIIGE